MVGWDVMIMREEVMRFAAVGPENHDHLKCLQVESRTKPTLVGGWGKPVLIILYCE